MDVFREDLLARINLWSFELPGLAARRDDIEPNLDFELQKFTAAHGRNVTMNKEARKKFLQFALDATTPWKGNFRDLNAAVTRMASLSPSGRISVATVQEEITRLKRLWQPISDPHDRGAAREVLGEAQLANLDLFDQFPVGRGNSRLPNVEVAVRCRSQAISCFTPGQTEAK